MSFSALPTETLFHIISYLSDPCDLKSLQGSNRRLCSAVRPIFHSQFSFLEGGSNDMKDYRYNADSFRNWNYMFAYTQKHMDDKEIFALRPYLERCNLAYIGSKEGWNRLVVALVKRHSIPVDETVEVVPQPKGWSSDPACPAICRFRSVLVEAALRGNIDLLKALVDECGISPLPQCWGSVFTRRGNYLCLTPLEAASGRRHLSTIEFLLRNGATYGESQSVSRAVEREDVEVLSTLLRGGCPADVAISVPSRRSWDKFGRIVRSLQYTLTKNPRPNLAIVKLLVDFGHDLNRCYEGKGHAHGTPLHALIEGIARVGGRVEVEHLEALEYLLEKGASTEAYWPRLEVAGCDDLVEWKGGVLPIHTAAEHGLWEVVEVLLRSGADPTAKTRNHCSRTATEIARVKGLRGMTRRLEEATKEYITRNPESCQEE